MLRGGAITQRDGRLRVAAEHTLAAAGSLRVPYPRTWPTATPSAHHEGRR
ncbi:hypothetical protein [Streptomyces rimosus]|nr:hypothetical protein [Streptomyces rimosus]